LNDQSTQADPAAPADGGGGSTRDRLLDAAMRLFHEQGYGETGVSTILREAGVHSGSLYHHFPSKEALLEGVLERYTELLEPVVMAPRRAEAADPIARVFALLAWYRAGLVETGCALGCPIGNLALEVSDQLPGARALIEENFRGWSAEIERWLEEAGDALPRDVDRGSLSRFVLTVMEGGLMHARAEKRIGAFDESVAQLRDYFERLQREAARGGGG
jgi:TetR/AcrR family transcriptional regulator, transcriptional repressor for nem operon